MLYLRITYAYSPHGFNSSVAISYPDLTSLDNLALYITITNIAIVEIIQSVTVSSVNELKTSISITRF